MTSYGRMRTLSPLTIGCYFEEHITKGLLHINNHINNSDYVYYLLNIDLEIMKNNVHYCVLLN